MSDQIYVICEACLEAIPMEDIVKMPDGDFCPRCLKADGCWRCPNCGKWHERDTAICKCGEEKP